jgi:hypothetical protein
LPFEGMPFDGGCGGRGARGGFTLGVVCTGLAVVPGTTFDCRALGGGGALDGLGVGSRRALGGGGGMLGGVAR